MTDQRLYQHVYEAQDTDGYPAEVCKYCGGQEDDGKVHRVVAVEKVEELEEEVDGLIGEENDIRAFLGRRGYALTEKRLVNDLKRIIWGLERRIEQLSEEKLPYRRHDEAIFEPGSRAMYQEPDFAEELDEDDKPFEPPVLVAGWDLAWGARLTFRSSMDFSGDKIEMTLAISDDVQRNGICARTTTRQQLGQFAANLLRIVNGDAPSRHDRWRQYMEAEGLGALIDAPFRFWICKDHRDAMVEWHGDVASCKAPGCTNTSQKSKEDKNNAES